MSVYDDFVWRLYSVAPYEIHSVVLPKDLEWEDEFTWNPVSHEIKNTLTGAVVINEYKATVGRPITLTGQDDMAWVQRSIINELMIMRNITGFKMKLDFVSASHDSAIDTWTFGAVHISNNVIFRHSETPLEFESVKRFDNFETDSWFKIRAIRLMDVGATDPLNPCY